MQKSNNITFWFLSLWRNLLCNTYIQCIIYLFRTFLRYIFCLVPWSMKLLMRSSVLETWHKGYSAPSVKNQLLNQEIMKSWFLSVSLLKFASGLLCHWLSNGWAEQLVKIATTIILLLQWIQIGFWYQLTRVVPDKGPLNGCYYYLLRTRPRM